MSLFDTLNMPAKCWCWLLYLIWCLIHSMKKVMQFHSIQTVWLNVIFLPLHTLSLLGISFSFSRSRRKMFSKWTIIYFVFRFDRLWGLFWWVWLDNERGNWLKAKKNATIISSILYKKAEQIAFATKIRAEQPDQHPFSIRAVHQSSTEQ